MRFKGSAVTDAAARLVFERQVGDWRMVEFLAMPELNLVRLPFGALTF